VHIAQTAPRAASLELSAASAGVSTAKSTADAGSTALALAIAEDLLAAFRELAADPAGPVRSLRSGARAPHWTSAP
jgi:hypothetical protein